ncbi:MAG: signal transduction histidine kinase, LytS [Mucilaginibacter sp.]|nr:signal transduction histidine kinase, LytS [Mucilaginibacter sp.]
MFQKNKVIYWGFWVLITIIFLYDTRYLITKASLPYFLVCGAVRVSLIVGMAWVNLQVLVPRYLFVKKYAVYISLVFLLVIGYLLLQSLYDCYLYGYVIGPNTGQLSGVLLYNFTHTSLYILLTVALKFSIDWYEQSKLMQEIRVEKLQTEVNYLRSQINPHFLFNALNNLYALTIKKSDLAPDVVLKLSELMEYMLYESDADFVPLEREINYLRNYLALERIRHGNEADIQLTVTGEADECSLPPFLILPLVENAFKHGISQTIQNAYLHIDLAITDELIVKVTNNKSNFQKDGETGGIGLANLKKRLILLYPDKHVLDITDGPIQFEVLLKIALSC